MRTTTYRGCYLRKLDCGWVWEGAVFGEESEDAFASLEDCKANVDAFFGPEASPYTVVDDEIIYRYEREGF